MSKLLQKREFVFTFNVYDFFVFKYGTITMYSGPPFHYLKKDLTKGELKIVYDYDDNVLRQVYRSIPDDVSADFCNNPRSREFIVKFRMSLAEVQLFARIFKLVIAEELQCDNGWDFSAVVGVPLEEGIRVFKSFAEQCRKQNYNVKYSPDFKDV